MHHTLVNPFAVLVFTMSLLSVQARPKNSSDKNSSPDDGPSRVKPAEPGCPGLKEAPVHYGKEKVEPVGPVGRTDPSLPIEERFRTCVYSLEYNVIGVGRIPALLKLSQYPMKTREEPTDRAPRPTEHEKPNKHEIEGLKKMGLFLEARDASGPGFHASILMKLDVPIPTDETGQVLSGRWHRVVTLSDIAPPPAQKMQPLLLLRMYLDQCEDQTKLLVHGATKEALRLFGRHGVWPGAPNTLADFVYVTYGPTLEGVPYFDVVFVDFKAWSHSLPESEAFLNIPPSIFTSDRRDGLAWTRWWETNNVAQDACVIGTVTDSKAMPEWMCAGLLAKMEERRTEFIKNPMGMIWKECNRWLHTDYSGVKTGVELYWATEGANQ